MLNGLDLFSGIGGLTVALEPWIRPVAYCERERYAQGVLLSRMATGDIPTAPIWDDVTTLDGAPWRGVIDIIYGGFPCQDISVAGHGAGLDGKRSGLFFEIVRLAEEIFPPFIFLENVPAIRTRGLDRVGQELASLGYDCRWDHLSAYDVGAPHKRERWFLLAHRNGNGCKVVAQSNSKKSQGSGALGNDANGFCHALSDAHGSGLRDAQQRSAGRRDDLQNSGSAELGNDGEAQPLANTTSIGRQPWGTKPEGQQGTVGATSSSASGLFKWSTEPGVGRVVNGLPLRVDRIRGLGNAVVPAQAREAFKRLMGLDL